MMRGAASASVIALLLMTGCSTQAGTQADVRANPVPPPPHGAYAGAYVDPSTYVESERIREFEEFESRVGRRLDIFHTFHTWTDPFPSEAETYFANRGTIPLISWAGTDLSEVVSGEHDQLISKRARALRRWGEPILLRWRWEMNRPNLAGEIGSPGQYVKAWRHLHRIFEKESVTNVAWVWCPLVDPLADSDFSAYYPGDDVVDWICADGYARESAVSWKDVFEPFLEWAEGVNRPILVGEFARATDVGEERDLATWLTTTRREMRRNEQIKAFSYFNNPRGASGDYDLLAHESAMNTMRSWLADGYFNVRKE